MACLAVGCAWQDWRSMERTQAAYEECVEEHSASDPECEALAESHRRAQQRYEENARRAWSCDPASEECPTPR